MPNAAAAVHGHRISTVVPGAVTGDGVVRHLSGADLAAKLHYLRAVYFFGHAAAAAPGIKEIKEAMFRLLSVYFPAAGRIRRGGVGDGGRPFLKCNDAGVRVVEAECDAAVEEWLAIDDEVSRDRHLVPDKVVGPDLCFSPTVYIQFTRFKCGGMAVGLSWAHVLGDATAAASFINLWGEVLAGKQLPETPPKLQNVDDASFKLTHPTTAPPPPLAVKQVDPVGDCWITPGSQNMATFSFRIPESKHALLCSKAQNGSFEALSALLWHCLGTIRAGREPKLVTVCRLRSSAAGELGNKQTLSTAMTDRPPTALKLPELAGLIGRAVADQRHFVEHLVGAEEGPDLVLYGANLTFVDLEGVDLHGLRINGRNPVHVSYSVGGVGEEGAVLVLRDAGDGRMVTVILPEMEIPEIRKMLRAECGDA